MAKFCTKCGKPLQDGKPCSCTAKEEKKISFYKLTLYIFKNKKYIY